MVFPDRQFFRSTNVGNWQSATDALETGFAFGYYGAFSDYTTQTIASTTTAYAMTLNTTDETYGVSVVSGSRITFEKPGTYNIQWSGQFDSTSTGDEDVSVWMRRNGTDVVGSTGYVSIPSKHGSQSGHALVGWNFVVTFVANEYVQFMWSSSSTLVAITTYGVGTAPTRPSTASLVFTVTQVGAVR